MDTIVQLAASALTIAGMYFYGNKSVWGPWLGILAQLPWWLIMVHGGLWGLLPVNALMFVIHIRNLIKWRRDASRETAIAQARDASALQSHHRKRRGSKAYEVLTGRFDV